MRTVLPAALAFGLTMASASVHADLGDQVSKLLPTDGAAEDGFGWPVDLGDGVVVAGAPGDDDNGSDSGSAYRFDAATGTELAKLLAADGKADDQLGFSVAIGDASDRDNFGFAVAIDADMIAASAPGDSDGGLFEAGSAYLYTAPDGEELLEVRADDREPLDNMGSGIAIANGLLVVGVDRDDDNGTNSGSAYVFGFGAGSCPADLDESGVVGLGDLLMLLAHWGGPGGDVDGDGTTNVIDLVHLLAAWGACSA